MLFKENRETILQKYDKYITEVWDKTNTVIMVDTGPEIGMFNTSDLILMFSPDGSLALQTERAYKTSYSAKEWSRLGLIAVREGTIPEDSNGIKSSFTYSVDYIDVVKYRKEWLDWVKEITSSV